MKYAFMDTNAGFFQGAYKTDCLEDAIKLYAADVGLNDEIRLDTFWTTVTAEQVAALEEWSSKGSKGQEPEISWHRLEDSEVREVLGYKPRD